VKKSQAAMNGTVMAGLIGTEGNESAGKPRETLLSLHLFHPNAENCVRLRVRDMRENRRVTAITSGEE
jgi:hypothetical protein